MRTTFTINETYAQQAYDIITSDKWLEELLSTEVPERWEFVSDNFHLHLQVKLSVINQLKHYGIPTNAFTIKMDYPIEKK